MSSSSAQVSVSKPLLSRRRCVRRAPTVASALPASADGRRAAVLSLIGAGAAALVGAWALTRNAWWASQALRAGYPLTESRASAASPSNAEEAAPLTALQAYDAMTGANEAPAETNYGELVGGFLGPVVVGVGGVLLFSVFVRAALGTDHSASRSRPVSLYRCGSPGRQEEGGRARCCCGAGAPAGCGEATRAQAARRGRAAQARRGRQGARAGRAGGRGRRGGGVD